jgi:hypothetical protein
MELHMLKNKEVQRKVRSILGELLVRKNLYLKTMSKEIGVSPVTFGLFLKDEGYIAGYRILVKIAHYIEKNGYDLKQLTKE